MRSTSQLKRHCICKGWASPRSLPLTACAAALLLPLPGCSGGVLDPQGPIGDANAQILLNAVEIMLVIVVPTIAVALAFAWWFRASNTRAHYLPDWAYSGRLELIVWSIPILVIVFLGGVIWIGSHELDPAEPVTPLQEPLQVQVVSLDWKWLFIYPDEGIASVNQLMIPAGVPVHFSITSASVMNMFFVPQLGSMIAAMNGMVTQLNLEAAHPGAFYGQSAQYSGDGFSGMHFTVHALPAAAFASWVSDVQRQGPDLDRAAYTALSKQSLNVRPFTYRFVDPGLFDAIARRQLPPGPGPEVSGGGRQPED
jgi:cytochrome o ubiquinol oxidase subunit II